MEFSEKDKQRFWAKVNKTDTCWLWTASLCKSHGQFYVDEKHLYAHRVAWLLAGNTIPEGYVMRHKCRSAHCVNPDHLETGTQANNNADKVRDGTSIRGTKNVKCKLTEDQVRAIKLRNKENKTLLAEEFGVHYATINKILIGQTWGWLT
jgi:hypothetical protein